MKKIANHGGLKKNLHQILGRNSRLDNLQAGVLRIKLKKLDKWINYRNQQAKIYYDCLSKIKSIKFVKKIENSKSSFHLMVIKTKYRDKLKKYLNKKNIETAIHYPKSLPQTDLFKNKHLNYCKKMLSLKYSKEIISLPIGEHLTLRQIKYICETIIKFFNV